MHCEVWGNRKQSRLVRGPHANPVGQQHTCEHSGHTIKHHMAGTKPMTHSLRNQEESRCIVWGGATEKQTRLVKGPQSNPVGQQHTGEH